jgi:hypothetical protein
LEKGGFQVKAIASAKALGQDRTSRKKQSHMEEGQ